MSAITDTQWVTFDARLLTLADTLRPYVRCALQYSTNPEISTIVAHLTEDAISDFEIRTRYLDLATTIMGGLNSWNSSQCRRDTTPNGTDTPRSKSLVSSCRVRDDHRCVITGRHDSTYTVEVAHIFPHALGSNSSSRGDQYWRFLEMFVGVTATDELWGVIGYTKINCLENLLCLEISLHRLLDRHVVDLDPEPTAELLYPGEYSVRFLWHGKRPLVPNEITTTRGQALGFPAVSVSHGDAFQISGTSTLADRTPCLPHPRLFRLRNAINNLIRGIKAAATTNPFDDSFDDVGNTQAAATTNSFDDSFDDVDDSFDNARELHTVDVTGGVQYLTGRLMAILV